jgi:hypothetical protein
VSTARRTAGEWARLLEDRDRWREESAELERLLSATVGELFDARALAAQLDRRTGPRRLGTDSVIDDLRKQYGRRHDDTCKLSVCQCSAGWDPATRRYDEALEVGMRVFRS